MGAKILAEVFSELTGMMTRLFSTVLMGQVALRISYHQKLLAFSPA